jgi:hypothetical protein
MIVGGASLVRRMQILLIGANIDLLAKLSTLTAREILSIAIANLLRMPRVGKCRQRT